MLDRSIIKLQNFFGETLAPPSPQNSTKPNNRQSVVLQPRDIGERSAKKLSKFFGERPPDDLIVDQLEEFFPGISIDMLKPGNRSSTIKDMVQNAILNKRMSRASVRHSARSDRVSRISQGQSPGRPTSRRLQELEDDYRAPLSSMTSSEYERGPKDFELDDWLSEVKQIASSDGDRSSSGLEPTIHWQKGALIGQGAFGKVYHALNLDTGEIMAVKQVLLGPENKSRKKKEDALQREIELLQDLNHEHIVRYLGAEASDTSFNVFLEYVSGGSISSVLRKFGRFDEELVQTMTVQILYGLEYLHDRNIIHRDIKGANGKELYLIAESF